VLLVERFHWPKPCAYALVVWMQMTSGFLMCRYVVFADGRGVPILRAYVQFAASMAVIRVADWSVYTFAVEFLKLPYVAVQIATTAIFISIKFLSAKAIFSKVGNIKSL
jgi:putative flippase GtrA